MAEKKSKKEKEFEKLKAAFFEDPSTDPVKGTNVRYGMKPYQALVAIYGDPYEHKPREKTPAKKTPPKNKKSEEETPKKKSKKDSEEEVLKKKSKKSEEDEVPKKKKSKKSEEDEEVPKKKKSKKDSEEEEEVPKKKKSKKNSEEEVLKKKSKKESEEEVLKKKSKKDSEEDEEEPKEKQSEETPKKNKKESKDKSEGKTSTEEGMDLTTLDMSIDKIITKCKTDKAFEKTCNKEFWKLKFHQDQLPVMNECSKSGDWVKEYKNTKAAQTEALKMVKVAIVTGKTSCQLNIDLNGQFFNLLPELMIANKDEKDCKINIECEFDEDEHLGHYTYPDHNWNISFMDEDATLNNYPFKDVLMFLTKIQYHIQNNEDIEITNDEGPLTRNAVEDAGEEACKQLIAYKMADYNDIC